MITFWILHSILCQLAK